MKNYSSSISKNTPQTKPVFGQNMTKNNAGGYSFEITPQERLERFILIGSEGGTYYVGEQALTVENAKAIVDLIKTNGVAVVATVVDFLSNNRAPKADAGLFVLALAATYGDELTKKNSYSAISRVCKTATHLFTFLANIQNLRGWSRGLRNGVAKFYTERTAEQIAYQMVKYRDRAGFTHKDALRLSHAKTLDKAKNELFNYAVGKMTEEQSSNPLVRAFGAAKTATGKELLGLIAEGRLTWEMIPNENLNDPDVLKALLPNMPTVALIRNLNRFSYNGLTEAGSDVVSDIVEKLTDEVAVKKSGIHPINVVNALLTYSSGAGQKGNKTWKVNQRIVDALSDTYDLALEALMPTGKKILVGVDISGSMQHAVNGMSMNASQIANVLAVTILKNEKNADLVWFDTSIKNPTVGRRSSIDEVLRRSPFGGGTDCAQPVAHALANKTKYDAIMILTDSETWAGTSHQIELVNQYRKSVNPDVKIVEVALVANGHSNMPNNDRNLLRVVGFDASVTEVINSFLE